MSPTSLHESFIARINEIVGPSNLQVEDVHCHVSPGSASEVSKLVGLASKHKATIIPVGKGGRSTPTDDLRPQILLNMRRMRHVLHLDETSLIVHVQAGLGGLELEKILNKRKLTIGDFPPAALDSTIGGLLSVRTPGKSSRRHGTFEDTVLGISAVLSDGRTLHTRVAPRRASGPDLARVICGSEGALGVITDAKLRIHRLPESRLLAAYKLPSFADALVAVRLALREEASPAAMRIYNQEEAAVHLGDICGPDEAILVVATVGPTSLAACDRNLVSSAVDAVGGRAADESLAVRWWRRRTGQADAKDAPPAPNLQISATPGRLAPVYQSVLDSAAANNQRARAHGSRFDSDGGVLFFTITDAEGTVLSARDPALSGAKDSAESAGAYLLEKTNPSLQKYFEALRDTLDPGRHLNPGVLR